MAKLLSNGLISESRNKKFNFFLTEPTFKTKGFSFEKYTNRKGFIIQTNSPPILSYIPTSQDLTLNNLEK